MEPAFKREVKIQDLQMALGQLGQVKGEPVITKFRGSIMELFILYHESPNFTRLQAVV